MSFYNLNEEQLTKHWYAFMETYKSNPYFIINLYFDLSKIKVNDKPILDYKLADAHDIISSWIEEGSYFLSETGKLYKSDVSIVLPGLLIGFCFVVKMHSGGTIKNLERMLKVYFNND